VFLAQPGFKKLGVTGFQQPLVTQPKHRENGVGENLTLLV
jgi:hypothetical protein